MSSEAADVVPNPDELLGVVDSTLVAGVRSDPTSELVPVLCPGVDRPATCANPIVVSVGSLLRLMAPN
jgi:hypothetical protein